MPGLSSLTLCLVLQLAAGQSDVPPQAVDDPQPDSIAPEQIDPDVEEPEPALVPPGPLTEPQPSLPAIVPPGPLSEPQPSLPEPEPEPPAIVVDAGSGDGVTVKTRDGRFELNMKLRAMFLATLEAPADGPVGADLVVRRARVTFAGRVFDPRLRYKIQLAVSPADLQEGVDGAPHRSPLLDAFVEFRAHRDLALKLGQYVLRHNRTRVISSSSLQLVDRSEANGELNLDRDLAIELHSNDLFGLGILRYAASISVGEGRDSLPAPDSSFLYLARVELLPLGDFDYDSEGDLAREPHPRLGFGVGYAYADRVQLDRVNLGSVSPDGRTFSYHHFTADAVFMWAGFSASTEMLFRSGRLTGDVAAPDPTVAPRNAVGAMLQLGYLFPELDLELSARAGGVTPLEDSEVSDERELGVGVGYFFAGHPLKLHGDLFQLWEDDGVFTGRAFSDGETRVRLLFQVSI